MYCLQIIRIATVANFDLMVILKVLLSWPADRYCCLKEYGITLHPIFDIKLMIPSQLRRDWSLTKLEVVIDIRPDRGRAAFKTA